MSLTKATGEPVARKRSNERAADNDPRDRIDLRADPEWVARVKRQAERLGLQMSAYVRQAVTRQLEADEASDPAREADS